MLWQPTTFIEGGKGICPTIFLTDCLKTKANSKMEGLTKINQKFQKAFFLVNFDVQVSMCSQGHPNLKEIGSLQTRHCINAYCKNSKEKKKLQIINKTMNNKMNKPKPGKIKNLQQII